MKIYRVNCDVDYKYPYDKYFRKESDAVDYMNEQVSVIMQNMEKCLCIDKRTDHGIDIVWVEDEYLGFTEEPVIYARIQIILEDVH